MIGLGNKNASLHVYIENIPPLAMYQELTQVKAMKKGDIKMIADLTGNHWRKIFNVFAKLLFELQPQQYPTWQALRDEHLLQANSDQLLLFSPPEQPNNVANNHQQLKPPNIITIIMGKTYANKLGLAEQALWLNEFFAINKTTNTIVCPYFDYRQLSNIKISQLANLIKKLTC